MKGRNVTKMAVASLFIGVIIFSCTETSVEGKTGVEASFTVETEELTAVFTNTSKNADSYIWQFGNDHISTEESPTHKYKASGSYDVKLIASTDAGSDEIIETVVISTTQPVANFSFIVDKLDVIFKNESEDAISYTWNYGDGTTGTHDENPVHAFPRTGIFMVKLIASGHEKKDTISHEVTVERNDGSVNPNFTLESPYKYYPNWYRGQMHMHTSEMVDGVLIGSPDAEDPADVMMATYRDKGYDFASISDHSVYTVDPGVEGILFISGEEAEANLDGKGVHANAHNITDTIPDGTLVEDMIKIPDALIQLNHPARASVQFQNVDHSGSELWAIEVSNWYNKRPMDLALWDNQISQGRRIWANATDDMHSAGDAGHNATMVNSTDLTLENILENLKSGNFYATEGGPDFVHMNVTIENGTIHCTTTNGNKIIWYKHDLISVQTTDGQSSSYTPVGNEIFVRVEVQNTGEDDDEDGIPNTAFSQPIFLIYEE